LDFAFCYFSPYSYKLVLFCVTIPKVFANDRLLICTNSIVQGPPLAIWILALLKELFYIFQNIFKMNLLTIQWFSFHFMAFISYIFFRYHQELFIDGNIHTQMILSQFETYFYTFFN
jgi:hypothetical protein